MTHDKFTVHHACFSSRSQSPDSLPLSGAMSIHNKFYREDSTPNVAIPMTFTPATEGGDESPGSAKMKLATSSIEQGNTENHSLDSKTEAAETRTKSEDSQTESQPQPDHNVDADTRGTNSSVSEKVTKL